VVLYLTLVLAVCAERLAELVTARRRTRRALARGGVEHGAGHYPVMVALHTGLLAGCLVEPLLLRRGFEPWVGWPTLGGVLLAQALRWWCIAVLGPRWTTRVVVVPGLPLVARGPYRWMRHPNYLAVVVEGAALPLVHGAWATACAFTVLNGALLATRIRCENAALAGAVAG
jgi:methyltransferase